MSIVTFTRQGYQHAGLLAEIRGGHAATWTRSSCCGEAQPDRALRNRASPCSLSGYGPGRVEDVGWQLTFKSPHDLDRSLALVTLIVSLTGVQVW
jgi:hypothetical protein